MCYYEKFEVQEEIDPYEIFLNSRFKFLCKFIEELKEVWARIYLHDGYWHFPSWVAKFFPEIPKEDIELATKHKIRK